MIEDPTIMAGLGEAGQLNMPSTEQADKAYPWLLQFLPTGLKRPCICRSCSGHCLVVGNPCSIRPRPSLQWTFISNTSIPKLAIGRQFAWAEFQRLWHLRLPCVMAPLLGGIDQAFQFIQEYTGVVSPGILGGVLARTFLEENNQPRGNCRCVVVHSNPPCTSRWPRRVGLTVAFFSICPSSIKWATQPWRQWR